MNGFDAVGFGALNVDWLFKVNKIAAAEEESFVVGFEESCGGSAANTMVGLARLGCRVGFVGKVANDVEGRELLEDFRNERVDVEGVAFAGLGRTGKVMGFVDERAERALYVDSGVNDTLEPNEIRADYVSQARFLHLTSFVGERSLHTQKEIITRLPENVKVSFDPGSLYAKRGLSVLEQVIRRAFVLMPNAIELEALTGKADHREGAAFMLEQGAAIVAVKLGSKGCYVTDGKSSEHIEPFKVKVVDTTGAGDAFCAGFLYGLISGQNIYTCGKIGNFVASRCITRMGSRAGLPTLKDLESEGLIQL